MPRRFLFAIVASPGLLKPGKLTGSRGDFPRLCVGRPVSERWIPFPVADGPQSNLGFRASRTKCKVRGEFDARRVGPFSLLKGPAQLPHGCEEDKDTSDFLAERRFLLRF